jgi:hypothetical protein
VTFAGYQADIGPYYGAADAFVLPALYDSFPDAAMEALASGLPVVTSTRSGAAELVTEHEAGFVCDSRDADALIRHMRALEDPQLRAVLGENARKAVLPLTPAAMTLKLVLIYKELLDFPLRTSLRRRPRREHGPAVPMEAPPLHGEDGLDSETLPAPAGRRSSDARLAQALASPCASRSSGRSTRLTAARSASSSGRLQHSSRATSRSRSSRANGPRTRTRASRRSSSIRRTRTHHARRAIRARRVQRPREACGTLVQSHERIACCDIYRAGDGVHAAWIEERLQRRVGGGAPGARRQRLSPLT